MQKIEGIMEVDERRIVVKANAIIEARYKLNPIEQKIILFLISLNNRNDEIFKLYRFRASDLIAFLDLEKNKNAYRELKSITKKLRRRDLIVKTETGELQLGWLASAEYFDKSGVVELEISEKMKPYLLNLQGCFTPYELRYITQFKSSYSFRIYELAKQYENTKAKKRIFEITELRKILMLEAQYKQFCDFEKRVLKPSKKEINEKSDINIDYDVVRQSRKPLEIVFLIEKKNAIKALPEPPTNHELFTQLTQYTNANTAQKWLAQHEAPIITETLAELERQQKSGVSIRNAGAWLNAAFAMGGYTMSEAQRQESEQSARLDQSNRSEEQPAQDTQRMRELQREFENKKRNHSFVAFGELPDHQQSALEKRFSEEIITGDSDTRRERFQQSGFKDYLIKNAWELFLQKELLPAEERDFVLFAQEHGFEVGRASEG